MGRRGRAQPAGLARGVPHSVLAAALQGRLRRTRSALRVVRTVAHVNETSTWPLLARSASGYVSSFGELQGRRRSRPAEEARADALRRSRRSTTAPVAARQPARRARPIRTPSAGLDLKYQVAPGLTLTGTINPDFGQVEADPAVVNLGAFETFFSGAPAVLRRRLRQLRVQHRLQRRRLHGPLLFAPHRPLAASRSWTRPTDGYASQPANTTIYRRREADGPRRQVLDRRAERGDGARGRAHRVEAPSLDAIDVGRRAGDQLLGRRARAASSPTTRGWLHAHEHEPPADRRAARSCRAPP